MKEETKTLVEIFFDVLKKKERFGHVEYETYSLYESLFQIVSKEVLENMLKRAYKIRNTDYWFAVFHKEIRQIGIFDDCYKLNPAPTIDKKEQLELNKLDKELDGVHVIMHKYEKQELRKLIPDTTNPLKEAEYSVLYKRKYRDLFSLEKQRRRWKLKDKLNEVAKQRINGHLDCVLWAMIHVDNNGILSQTMERTFNEFAFLKRQRRKKPSVV